MNELRMVYTNLHIGQFNQTIDARLLLHEQ